MVEQSQCERGQHGQPETARTAAPSTGSIADVVVINRNGVIVREIICRATCGGDLHAGGVDAVDCDGVARVVARAGGRVGALLLRGAAPRRDALSTTAFIWFANLHFGAIPGAFVGGILVVAVLRHQLVQTRPCKRERRKTVSKPVDTYYV